MRILVVSQYFWPENFRINELVCSLSKLGHEIDVLTGKPNYPEGKFYFGYSIFGKNFERWKETQIYRLPILSRGSNNKLRLVMNYLSFIVSGIIFAPWMLRNKKYDVIFVYGISPIFQAIPASFIGWIKRLPVVLWVQDLWPQSAEATGYVKSAWLLALLEKAVRFIYAHTDLLLVQSEAFIKPVSKLSSNIPVTYYPNSADQAFYAPSDVNAPEIESLKSGFSVLFAGNIGKAQAVETIFAAAEKLHAYPEIKIVMLGSGSKEEWIRKQIDYKKLTNVYLEGRFPVETMPTLMRQASILLVSLTAHPIFSLTVPNKIQAYLAVGRPIIASLNGEGARIINEARAGLSVPAEDAEGLALAILKMYRMTDEERLQLGENGRAFFKKNFDEKTLTADLIKHFESLVKKEKN